MVNAALSLAVLASFALLVGAVFQWRRAQRQKAGLMVLLAAIMLANVVIWALPNEQGVSLADSPEAL